LRIGEAEETSAPRSSLNWGSQSGLEDNRLDEIGLYFEGQDLATSLLKRFEAANQ
jgi:hypothetical protein